MLTTNQKKSLHRVMAAGTCSAIIAVAALAADVSAGTFSVHSATNRSTGDCLYSAQLANDPELRTAYTTKVAATKWGLNEASDEDLYESNIEVGNAYAARLSGSEGGIDRLSSECLSCHDGVMAQNFRIRVKNNPNNRVMGLEDIIGGHPVGMEYDRYLSVNGKEYRNELKYNSEVVFAEGKIGCLTCHNPLNRAKGHLVMTNDRSELCFSCHGK